MVCHLAPTLDSDHVEVTNVMVLYRQYGRECAGSPGERNLFTHISLQKNDAIHSDIMMEFKVQSSLHKIQIEGNGMLPRPHMQMKIFTVITMTLSCSYYFAHHKIILHTSFCDDT